MNKHITKIDECPNKHWDEMKKTVQGMKVETESIKKTLNKGKTGNVKLKN